MAYRPYLKVCGVKTPDDARLVSRSGADYCGILVDIDFSERSLPLEEAHKVAAASTIPVIILLCNPEMEEVEAVLNRIKPHGVQLLCEESPAFVETLKSRLPCEIWKTIHLPRCSGQPAPEEYVEAGADKLLVDSVDISEGFVRFGGTGKVADWNAAAAMIASVSVPVFLAGGISADNIARALTDVRPHGIDLCSGVEAAKGKKDPEKLRALVSNLKAARAKMEENQG